MLRVVAVVLTNAVALLAQQVPPLLGDHVEPSSAMGREHTHHASLRGRIVDGAGEAVAGARVFVYGHQPFYQALPIAEATTDAKGEYACEVTGLGRTRLFVASPDDRAFAMADLPLTLCSGAAATRDATLVIPDAQPAPATVVRGRLLAADGVPISGAFLRMQDENTFDPAAFVRSAADGTFAITTRLGVPTSLVAFVGRRRIEIRHRAGGEKPEEDGLGWTADLQREVVLSLERCEMLPLRAEGADGFTFARWIGGVLEPCAGGVAPAMRGESEAKGTAVVSIVARAPGHLPQCRTVPAETFDFSGGEERTLRVIDDTGAPLVGASVDVCLERPRFEEATLETVRTDDEGRVRLRGAPDARHVVYAYADRHGAARGIWAVGPELQLVLPQRSGLLAFEVKDDVASVYVRRKGVFDPAAIVYPTPGALRIPLTPGSYEVTLYGKSKPVVAAVRAHVFAGKVTEAAPNVDQRPTVRVRVPAALAGNGEWWAAGTRRTFGGMITKWSIHTQRGGPMPRRELVAEVEELANAPGADREFLLRFPISGRFTITVGDASVARRWFRECVVEFGVASTYSIDVPARSVDLRAKVAKYPDIWAMDGAFHGVVGPRLCLEPVDDTAFGMLVALPEPAAFVAAIPAPGRYALHHHLYETGLLWSEEGTWGGRDVELGDAALDVGELARGPDSTLEVAVRGAKGEPLNGVLGVRDRMFEAWSDDLAQNTTLDDASDPIPTPPSARLENGIAKLTRIRAGRLQFTLDLDDGRRVFFTRPVDPSRRLDVELPDVPR